MYILGVIGPMSKCRRSLLAVKIAATLGEHKWPHLILVTAKHKHHTVASLDK